MRPLASCEAAAPGHPLAKAPRPPTALAVLMAAAVLSACASGPGFSFHESSASTVRQAPLPTLRANPTGALSNCSITLTGSSGTTVDVSLAGPPGNQPRTYKDFVALWQSSVIAWTAPPQQRTPVLLDGETGTLVLVGVSISRVSYTVAYAVGPDISDICASAQLSPDGSVGPTDAVAMRIVSLGVSSLSIHYHTLDGYLPARSKNWIGLWQGRVSPYNAPEPIARVAIATDITEGEAALNAISLSPGILYTLIYFMGGLPTTAAVVLRFIPEVQ